MPFAPSEMVLSSSAFESHGKIPAKYTGEGKNVSPPLSWAKAPAKTKAFALICHDPDAPLVCPKGACGFVHWVLYGIPGSVHSLTEGEREYVEGLTDSGKSGYSGPMPPKGHGLHSYYFWIIALDEELDLEPGLTMRELLARIEPHIIGMNRLVGLYERR